MARKITDEQIAQMQMLQKSGMDYSGIAEKMEIGYHIVEYYLDEEKRRKRIEIGKRNAQEKKEDWNKYNKIWRRKNPDKYKKSILLSALKGNLKRGVVTRQEVIDVLNKYTVEIYNG